MEETLRTTLLGLPDELLQDVLSYLEPVTLAKVAQTCRHLLVQSCDDLIWQPLVNANLPESVSEPWPLKSFRDLFVAHHPHWFLTKHKIWFGDGEHMGKLLLSHYDPGAGSIEAYAVTATSRFGPNDWTIWEKDPEVKIMLWEPQISLDTNQPVLKLDVDSQTTEDHDGVQPNSQSQSIFSQELRMETFQEGGLFASFMLCRALPEVAITESTRIWPPLRFPTGSRTRNLTSSAYHSSGHRPSRLSEVSQHNFRLRKWVQYTGRRVASPSVMSFQSAAGSRFTAGLISNPLRGIRIRMPEDITTYAALPEAVYMPTPAKPWQGVWCGDYSGHGCEFLIIRQPDKEEEKPLPVGMAWLQQWFRGGRRDSVSSVNSTDSVSTYASAMEEADNADVDSAVLEDADDSMWTNPMTGLDEQLPQMSDSYTDYSDAPTGRLEAIKLTGDPNIPRGEYTFIAPDIGHGGFLRIADEEPFRGARVVRSAGHIAGTGFREDQYTPSQLIMVSHDKIAQLWEGFSHICYFQRVDLDALMRSRTSRS